MNARDRKILIYLGALVIVALAYFFGVSPMLDKISAQTETNARLEVELRQKLETKANSEVFEQGIKDFNKEFKAILSEFPNGILDEKSLLFIADTESEIPIWLYEVKFATVTDDFKKSIGGNDAAQQPAPAPTTEEEQDLGAQPAEGAQPTDPAATPTAEQGVKTETSLEGMYGIDYELGLAYKADYYTLKDFLNHINEYPERMVIKNMEGKYKADTDTIEGTITLSQYAISSPDRPMPNVPDTETPLGIDNIFNSEFRPMLDEELRGEVEGSDYFITVNCANDNMSAKIIGRSDDVKGSSFITSNNNTKETIEFSITGSEGKYKASYKLGERTFNDIEIEKTEDERLVLRIISSARMDEEDESAIALRLKNETDRILYVSIIYDDISNPRVDIEEKTGEIEVSQ